MGSMKILMRTQLKRFSRQAQSTIEYILVVAAVIIVVAGFLSPPGPFRRAVDNSLSKTVDRINALADDIPVP